MPRIAMIERISQEIAGPHCDRPYAYAVRQEAADILSEAFEVVEWRFGMVQRWRVERLAIELARHHRSVKL
jgi:hypothetical protein